MVRITLVPGWRRLFSVAAGAAAFLFLPVAAFGSTIMIGGENYDFNPPTGLCFLDPDRVAEDRTPFGELDPGGDRLKLAAVFADCGQLDAWRADPRARVRKFGRILIDQHYLGDPRFTQLTILEENNLIAQMQSAADEFPVGTMGEAELALEFPNVRSAFAAIDTADSRRFEGWKSVRRRVMLMAVEARVAVGEETLPYRNVTGIMLYGGTVVQVNVSDVSPPDDDANRLINEVVRVADALRGGTARAVIVADSGKVTIAKAGDAARPSVGASVETVLPALATPRSRDNAARMVVPIAAADDGAERSVVAENSVLTAPMAKKRSVLIEVPKATRASAKPAEAPAKPAVETAPAVAVPAAATVAEPSAATAEAIAPAAMPGEPPAEAAAESLAIDFDSFELRGQMP